MAKRLSGGAIERFLNRRALRRWSRTAAAAASADLGLLRQQRAQARALRQKLDDLLFVAEGRLALPRIGSTAFPRPAGTDWSWRPQLWRGPLPRKGIAAAESKTRLGDEITLFHDCRVSELTLRQLRNTKEADLAPFGFRMDVFRFDGSFLSLAIDLPKSACEGLKRRHLVRLDMIVELEKPLEIFARLNVKHGPNTEQIVRELDLRDATPHVEFDLGYTKLHEKRVEAIWIDLIFEGPEMNQVTLRDLTLSRYPRAQL
ncbi:MAG: hypothetical protein HLUCCA08_16745 [Rhodobacteraceae bacterium HLUCCA08]|nr:MAG: hypothetical protein HLUCCA08_16745 [Rhodobacteraceae bacterium HLUCCA08]